MSRKTCRALLEVLQQLLPTPGSITMLVLLQNAQIPDIKVPAQGFTIRVKGLSEGTSLPLGCRQRRSGQIASQSKAWTKKWP